VRAAFPDSVLSRIDKQAFYASGLISIDIPASVKVIAQHCFSVSTSLSSVTFAAGARLEQIEEFVFYNTRLTRLILPGSLTFLSGAAFVNCDHVESLFDWVFWTKATCCNQFTG
jgi:hypothetical protein